MQRLADFVCDLGGKQRKSLFFNAIARAISHLPSIFHSVATSGRNLKQQCIENLERPYIDLYSWQLTDLMHIL